MEIKMKNHYHSQLFNTFKLHQPGQDWMDRHHSALTAPRTEFEKSFVELLSGWLRYADAHHNAYGSGIGADYILGPAWAQIAGGLITLLNGDLGRLDGGTLDGLLRRTLTAEDLDGENA